jgi:hypothetical protein
MPEIRPETFRSSVQSDELPESEPGPNNCPVE